jgi:ubiquitin C-terminal hydrolase
VEEGGRRDLRSASNPFCTTNLMLVVGTMWRCPHSTTGFPLPLGGMGKKKRHSSRRANPKPKSTSRDRKASSSPLSNDGPGIRGITNLGNTCFFNSSLQALAAATEETDPNLYHEVPVNLKGEEGEQKQVEETLSRLKVFSQFSEVMKLLGMSSQKILNPSQLLTSLTTKVHQFNNRRQHDSHELIIHLISSILEEFEKHEIKRHRFLSLFEGNLVGIVQCQQCQYRSCSINKFVDISLEIPGSRHLFHYPSRRVVSLPTRVTRSKKKETEAQLAVVEEQKESTEESPTEEVPDESHSPEETEGEAIEVTPGTGPGNQTEDGSEQLPDGESLEKEILLQILEPSDEIFPAPKSSSSVISLFDCLKQYTSRETLTVESGEGYNCPKCSKVTTSCGLVIEKRSASKRLLLLDLPSLLILHLKRLLPGGKCSSSISFPLQLSLEPFIGARSPDTLYPETGTESPLSLSRKYLLRAVIVHIGSGSGGHYIAYVHRLGQWFYTSDAATRKATEAEVLESQAYILMYRRASAEEGPLAETEVMKEATECLDSLNLKSSSPSPSPLAEPRGDEEEGTEGTDHEEDEEEEVESGEEQQQER